MLPIQKVGGVVAGVCRTYGFDRFAVLVAFVNGIALFAIAAWIVTEAAQRLSAPVNVRAWTMLWIAAAGLGVNVLSFLVLRSGDRDNLNIRAAVLHVVGDLLGSVAAVVAAIVILMTGWTPIDPLLSIVVALIIVRSAWRVVADSGHILLEGSPAGVDSRALREHLRAALLQLDESYREPLMLQVLFGYSTEEIATQMELSVPAVLTRLYRARHLLRRKMLGEAPDESRDDELP